jgi:hypothetical protein
MVGGDFGERLLLGTDGARRSLWATLGGAPGPAWIVTGFGEALKARGLDDDAITLLYEINPARHHGVCGLEQASTRRVLESLPIPGLGTISTGRLTRR